VFREMVLTAVVAGLAAAVVMTAVQSIWVTPLILQAETYEDAAEAAPAPTPTHPAAATEHHHHADAWKPQNGWPRMLFTFAATTLMGIGYAFLLVAVYVWWRHPANAAYGLLYGLAGFLVFFAAPGLGLSPELPGTAAAALASRQYWWVGTAMATAAGLALIFMQSGWWLRAVGVALLIVPHLIAAPQPAVEGALAPASLQSQFVVATTVCSILFWLSLGWSSALAYQKIFLAKAELSS
jgi:cobalt transporter subunit CbtA